MATLRLLNGIPFHIPFILIQSILLPQIPSLSLPLPFSYVRGLPLYTIYDTLSVRVCVAILLLLWLLVFGVEECVCVCVGLGLLCRV